MRNRTRLLSPCYESSRSHSRRYAKARFSKQEHFQKQLRAEFLRNFECKHLFLPLYDTKAEQTLYFCSFNVAAKLKKNSFITCVFVRCKERKACLNTERTQIRNHYFIIYAWAKRRTKLQNPNFNLASGDGKRRVRESERHLNIWYHGQGDCLYLHPMDEDGMDGGSRAFFILIYFTNCDEKDEIFKREEKAFSLQKNLVVSCLPSCSISNFTRAYSNCYANELNHFKLW